MIKISSKSNNSLFSYLGSYLGSYKPLSLNLIYKKTNLCLLILNLSAQFEATPVQSTKDIIRVVYSSDLSHPCYIFRWEP